MGRVRRASVVKMEKCNVCGDTEFVGSMVRDFKDVPVGTLESEFVCNGCWREEQYRNDLREDGMFEDELKGSSDAEMNMLKEEGVL